MQPSRTMRAFDAMGAAYRRVFAESPAAAVLSRPKPVRWTGFDVEMVVRSVRVEADDVVSVTLAAADGARLPEWHPGAHLDLFLPSGKQRQYSLCGDPADRSAYRIAVRRIADGGGGSREVHELTPGAAVRIRGPRNAFRQIDASSYLFVAGGIGITPILPMVRSASLRGIPWRLVYLGRDRVSMPFVDELVGYRGGEVDVRTDDLFGPPDIATIVPLAEPGAAIYLCGPAPLMAAARVLVRDLNPTASLHTERFAPLPVVDGAPFQIRLQRTGKTIAVAADESALQAIRRELPGIAYSCQQGFCGSCKVRVLDGGVRHRDTLLPERERDNSMLICVSRADGAALTLDL
ncbi:PDR/VanB family oxidoreductase [Nocardia sp. NPDC127579]|uniref:PDR/VanB family oxidoreductase n=1 Tax=Nocardia sp. NPDC127579 TaxID=3345402 RepID=UPI00363FBD9A